MLVVDFLYLWKILREKINGGNNYFSFVILDIVVFVFEIFFFY